MTNFKLPNESFPYAFAAQQEAQRAGTLANYGYRHKELYYAKEAILRKWQEYMVNAPSYFTMYSSYFL
ncbi:MAG: hypothetical protein IPK76_12995 [Lewinellaceae bacterium]|nr:hypothetical protein [Lewinellaceae bacterium]